MGRPAALCLCLSLALAGALAGACNGGDVPPGFQGIVEHDERLLGFEVGGRIVAVDVDRGQRVSAGQHLAQLDDALTRPQRDVRAAELASAQAQLDLLRAGSRPEEVRQAAAQLSAARATVAQVEHNLARAEELTSAGASAFARRDDLRADLDRAKAEVLLLTQRLQLLRKGARDEEIAAAGARVDAAAAALASTDRLLERMALAAPLEGEVIDVLLHPGEVAPAGAPVLVLADTGHPFVDAFVPVGSLDGVRIGLTAQVAADGTAESLSGTVEYIAQQTEFTPRFLFSEQERPNLVTRVRVRIADPERRLHAGVPAFVTLASGQP